MHKDRDLYDTSNYDVHDMLYSKVNSKVVGKMKDECGGKAAKQFVGLRPKMYSLLTADDKTKMTAKGVKRCYIEKHVTHQMFLQVLQDKTLTRAQFYNFRSIKHSLFTMGTNKVCLSAYDDKRYILADGINTLAYGHYCIPL